jgi:methylenetetrahydrofolate reductase (NADPH)
MPITNYTQLMRFSDMCGAEIPRWVRLKLASFGDDSASIKAFGLDVVSKPVRTPAGGRRARACISTA